MTFVNKELIRKENEKYENSNHKHENDEHENEKDESPYQKNAPWPTMRGDIKNSGRLKNLNWPMDLENSEVIAKESKTTKTTKVVHFHTENAIFSTPIIDANENIFVGSADHFFYSFDPIQEKIRWKFDAGEIIDSAGCIDKEGNIYIGTGCSKIHSFTSDGKEIWTYDNLNNRKKEQFTFSSNFWFEGNVVLGPDGALYVGNDDFFLYKMTKSADIIWGYRTGFFVWSASSFWNDLVYTAGFDHILYALDMNSGKLKWKSDLHGALVGSPAIGENDIIYQSSFNGNVYAVKCNDGKIIWKFGTGSHIYASAAVSADNTVYIGSTNGTFYALDGATGEVKWSYYIGDSIRSSASIGPDPESKVPYLIYFGGGDGKIYAIEPNGVLRWSYDTLLKANNTDYPNINASIALGRSGLCAACSTGDVVYIPYEAYKAENANTEGFGLGAIEQSKQTIKNGVLWYYVTPGGRLQNIPITGLPGGIQEIDPTTIISLRLILYDEKGRSPMYLIPESITIESNPGFENRVEVQSDSVTMNIIPIDILTANTNYNIKTTGKYKIQMDQNRKDQNRRDQNQLDQIQDISSSLSFKTRNPPEETSMLSSANKTFRIVHMAVPQPAIIPSIDQIGLASLEIPFSIITSDPENQTFTAYGVQKFGEVGVPQKRISYYAFSGKILGDYFQMDCRNCEFEITSFTIPLDLFRLTGLLKPDGTIAKGSNLLIEKDWHGSSLNLMKDLSKNSPVSFSMLKDHLKSGGFKYFVKAAFSFFPALFRQLFRGTWKSWGLLTKSNRLMGVGTYRLEPIQNKESIINSKVQIFDFRFDQNKAQIIADVEIPNKEDEWKIPLSILLLEKATNLPIPINYTTSLKRIELEKEAPGKGIKRIILKIPKSKSKSKNSGNNQFTAYLMADIYPIKTLDL